MQLDDPLVNKLPDSSSILRKTFSFNVGNLNLRPEYWQAVAIILLVFLLVVTFARWRHLYVKWNLQGFLPSVMLGFILAFVLEGFLIIGGRTLFTELLGWENAPKPISTALDEGRVKLANVLGASQEIPGASADGLPTYESVLNDYKILSSTASAKVKENICR